jgi:hypothetical protein
VRDDLFRMQGGRWRAFICRCAPPGIAEADELMAFVREKLAAGSENLMPREVTDRYFLTMVVQSLEWDYHAAITGLDTDQWSGVAAESNRYRPEETVRVFVECDLVEDGVAAAWYFFYQHARKGGQGT